MFLLELGDVMLFTAISLMLAAQDGEATVALESDTIVAHSRPVGRSSSAAGLIETIGIRITSPEGELWRGTVRVGRNTSSSYHQSLSQPPANACPANEESDRSESRSLNFSVYAPESDRGPQYNVNVSWARPTVGANCRGSGTRTVQISDTLELKPGERRVIEGDAGLRVEVSRP